MMGGRRQVKSGRVVTSVLKQEPGQGLPRSPLARLQDGLWGWIPERPKPQSAI